MGYYSFYKIFKDIIKTIFGKRAFRILLIVLIIVLIGTKVFAYSLSFDPPVFTDEMSSYKDYVLVSYSKDANNYVYVGLNDTSKFYFNGSWVRLDKDNTNKTWQARFNQNWNVITYWNGNIWFPATSPEFQIEESTFDIMNTSNNTVYFEKNIDTTKYPEIVTSIQDLETLNFDVISINAWDYSNEDIDVLFYDLNYGTDTTNSLYPKTVITLNKDTTYFQSNLSADPEKNAIYWIPNTETGLNFFKGGKYGIKIAKRNYDIGSGDGVGNGSFGDASGGGFRGDNYVYEYLGDTVTFTISDTVAGEVIASLNMSTKDKTEEKQHDETLNAINNQTQATENLTNSITDSSVDTDIDLPQDTTEDITQNGINNIFDSIYNAFTSDTANDIIFPIPFTNKNITLSANYLKNMLQNNNANWVIMFVQMFWWYVISRFIISDISKKINKIKSGNIENIENNNIKEEML